MKAITARRLQVMLGVFAVAITAACAAPSAQDVRPKEPPQCKMGEQYICIGKSASRLKTDNETDYEICRCARLNELPQMGPNTP